MDKCRVDGSRVLVAEVEVGDGSGSISLRARDEQIDVLREVSAREGGGIVLRNCTMELYQEKHLTLLAWTSVVHHPALRHPLDSLFVLFLYEFSPFPGVFNSLCCRAIL